MELFSRIFGLDTQPPILLIHGLFGASDNLSNLARHLSQTHQVHALDARNHGRSPHADSMTYSEMAADVLRYIDSNGLDKVAVLGHSMGGKISMTLALDHPERVTHLLVADIAPVNYPAHHNDIFNAFRHTPLDQIASRKEAESIFADHIETMEVRQFLLKSLYKNNNGKFDWRFNLSSILANYSDILSWPEHEGKFVGPTIFIVGGESNYVLPEYRSDILTFFPNASSKLIQGVGHWLHAEKPAIFNQICARFLNE